MTALPHLNHVGRGALSPSCLMSVPPGDGATLIIPSILGSYIPLIIICILEDVKPYRTVIFRSYLLKSRNKVFDVLASLNLTFIIMPFNKPQRRPVNHSVQNACGVCDCYSN